MENYTFTNVKDPLESISKIYWFTDRTVFKDAVLCMNNDFLKIVYNEKVAKKWLTTQMSLF